MHFFFSLSLFLWWGRTHNAPGLDLVSTTTRSDALSFHVYPLSSISIVTARPLSGRWVFSKAPLPRRPMPKYKCVYRLDTHKGENKIQIKDWKMHTSRCSRVHPLRVLLLFFSSSSSFHNPRTRADASDTEREREICFFFFFLLGPVTHLSLFGLWSASDRI